MSSFVLSGTLELDEALPGDARTSGNFQLSELNKLFRYAVTGGASYMLLLGVTTVMHESVGMSERLAFGLALCVAYLFNLIALRGYVFGTDGPLLSQALRYALASTGFRVAEFFGYSALLGMGVRYWIALTAVVVVSNFAKYFMFRRFVFR